MQINFINIDEWRRFLDKPDRLVARIDNEVFIVRNFMSTLAVDKFKKFCVDFSNELEASWHPCIEGCPDYHRIHHQYPDAHVKSTQHGYYFHPWNDNFEYLNSFECFSEIFEFKARATGKKSIDFISNTPSKGPIARILCHQYPPGGGGQDEHIDPVSPFATVQTIVQASDPGKDYLVGGLYINDSKYGVINIDFLTRKGDLILISPGVKHGVARIDPHEPLNWRTQRGRWIIMPIIIHSDLIKDPLIKPTMTEKL
jgi:hypothetical protein